MQGKRGAPFGFGTGRSGRCRRSDGVAWQRRPAPLAGRLGIWQFKWELEDLAFRDLEPQAYQRIVAWLDQRGAKRKGYIRQVSAGLHRALGEAGIKAEITGRATYIYSIWNQMRLKQLDVQQLFACEVARAHVEVKTFLQPKWG